VKNKDKIDEIRKQVEARKIRERERLPESGKKHEKKSKITSIFIQDCLQANELGDGMLFSELNRGRFVYNKSSGEWLYWKDHHWKRDIMGYAEIDVESTVVDSYLRESVRIGGQIAQAIKDDKRDLVDKLQNIQKEIYKRVKRLRAERGRTNCLKFSHTCQNAIAIDGDELDQNPWHFACKNGVIDLRTGELKPGRPEDYIHKSSPVEFGGIDAPAPKWEMFLREIFQDKESIICFVQRLFGYAATGSVVERILPILSGVGWNGKSTMCEMIMYVLGDYAAPIPAELLLDQGRVKSSSGPSPDIMALRGLRACFASETDENRRFSTSKVKILTGSDQLVGRRPHDKDQTTFSPSHKLFLITNATPNAPVSDFAFWERVNLINFNLSFVDRKPQNDSERPRDKDLPEKLKQELSGILAWIIRGCLEWQRIGLDSPPEVQKETLKFKRSLDNLSDFIDECCDLGDELQETAKKLYDKFGEWWTDNISNKVPAQKTFGGWMNKRGFEKDRTGPKGSYVYHGVSLIGF
jgi:putative DNA primase/helicase